MAVVLRLLSGLLLLLVTLGAPPLQARESPGDVSAGSATPQRPRHRRRHHPVLVPDAGVEDVKGPPAPGPPSAVPGVLPAPDDAGVPEPPPANAPPRALVRTAATGKYDDLEQRFFGGGDGGIPAEATSAPAATQTPPAGPVAEDLLRMGGLLYQEVNAQNDGRTSAGESALSLPTLAEVYLDGRPTDRIRGYVRARLFYDAVGSRAAPGVTLDTQGRLSQASATPHAELDQLWVKFDVARTVFVTAGLQHVKWGTGRFWNPTDFLASALKDPLATLDARTGTTLLKLHLPWEAKGWNAYAIALFDVTDRARTLSRVGGAVRAEVTLGTAELGLSAVAQRGRHPRLGADFSCGLGIFDVYADVALRTELDTPVYQHVPGASPTAPLASQYQSVLPAKPIIQAAGGILHDLPLFGEGTLSFELEYFYNSAGYTDPAIYGYLASVGALRTFYTGKHYAGALLALQPPKPLQSFGLASATVANFSDLTFVERLDLSWTLGHGLTLSAYGAYHFGRPGGELRLFLDVPAQPQPDGTLSEPLQLRSPQVEAGLSVSLSI